MLLADQLHTVRDDSERFEVLANHILPDVDYNAAQSRYLFRKEVPNDRDTYTRTISKCYK